jgi:iron(III) transport system permease protein
MFALCIAALVLVPVVSLAITAFWSSASGFEALPSSLLVRTTLETFQLTAGVLVLAMLIGVSAGWIIATYEFPGRSILGWLLILPFAVPTYISAYTYVEAMDFFGPFQGFFRDITGFKNRTQYWFPEMRSPGGAIIVNAIVLYPYFYVASRAAFSMQGGLLVDAARMLGCSRLEALRRVVLPAIWPVIAAAGTLVFLETLNDIGASQYLGIETYTVAIFNIWLTRGSLAGAAKLALMVFLIVISVLWFERWLRNNRRFVQSSRNHRLVSRARLTHWRAALATLSCLLPVIAGFAIPVVILIRATWHEILNAQLTTELLKALLNSILVSSAATILIIVSAFLVALASRFTRISATDSFVRISAIGYALPGTVLVIGLLPALGMADAGINSLIMAMGGHRVGLVLSGSIFAVTMAYVIRFLAIGIEQLQSGLGSLSRNTDFAAQTLGCGQARLGWRIHLPAIRPAVAGAAILVFVDCLKELPATLLLRPLNFETLATHLYGHASRGSFEDGGPAALMIVAAGLLPLIFMNRLMEQE